MKSSRYGVYHKLCKFCYSLLRFKQILKTQDIRRSTQNICLSGKALYLQRLRQNHKHPDLFLLKKVDVPSIIRYKPLFGFERLLSNNDKKC